MKRLNAKYGWKHRLRHIVFGAHQKRTGRYWAGVPLLGCQCDVLKPKQPTANQTSGGEGE